MATNHCPVCGSPLQRKVSFKVPKCEIDKRETVICTSCDYATILETNQEKRTRLGKFKAA